MELLHHKGVHSKSYHYSNRVRHVLPSRDTLLKLRLLNKEFLKKAVIPFSVVSTLFLTAGFDKTYAATTDDLIKKQVGFDQYLDSVGEIQRASIGDKLTTITDTFHSIIEWFKEMPDMILEGTINLMDWSYQLLSSIILKTPIWIFDNMWFENTTYLFGIFSIGVVSVLTTFESMKMQMQKHTGKKGMDIKTIARRWFIVAGLSSIAPTIFKKMFEGLNFLSEKIINLSGSNMSLLLQQSVQGLDLLTLITFNIVLFSLMIPIFLQNFRRFFDIMCLGVISPLAGTAWIFDSHRHYFRQWWDNFKRLSLVQIVYAVFLMIMGLFIFGTATPTTTFGVLLKVGIVIGGFYRMANPPTFVKSYLDKGEDIRGEFNKYKKQYKIARDNVDMVKNGFDFGKSKTMNFTKFMSSNFAHGTTVKPNSRMSRYHGK